MILVYNALKASTLIGLALFNLICCLCVCVCVTDFRFTLDSTCVLILFFDGQPAPCTFYKEERSVVYNIVSAKPGTKL